MPWSRSNKQELTLLTGRHLQQRSRTAELRQRGLPVTMQEVRQLLATMRTARRRLRSLYSCLRPLLRQSATPADSDPRHAVPLLQRWPAASGHMDRCARFPLRQATASNREQAYGSTILVALSTHVLCQSSQMHVPGTDMKR